MEIVPICKVEYKGQEVSEQYQWDYEPYDVLPWTDDITNAINDLANRLEEELRAAKSNHFSAGEVLLPFGLLQNIARDILTEAEHEPCGLRGCDLYLLFVGEDGRTEPITLGNVRLDHTTTPTFEIRLLLKQSTAGWNSFLPQFLKKITRGGTVMIDSKYKLEKEQLYR